MGLRRARHGRPGGGLLAWTEPGLEPRPRGPRDAVELGLACGLLVALGLVHGSRSSLVFPLLLWPALRFGLHGASAGLCALTGAVMAGALAGGGPQSSIEAQGLLCIAAVCALGPAAVMADHRRGQRDLVESEQRYRTLFEHAPFGLGVADLTGQLLAWNRAMLEPGGYTDEDVVRIGNVAALYADPAERTAALALVARDGRLDRHPVRFKRKDGSAYDALLTLRPIVLHGRPCMLAMGEDVTAQRKAEEAGRRLQAELHHARRMEAVGVFAAGFAHDFNNLLTAIYGYGDLAARRAGEDAALREALQGVRDAADQASAITRSLLAFSRKAPAARRPLDLGTTAREGARLLRTLVPAGVQLTVDATPGVWVEADPGQLHQVLMNLLLNGCEAMPAGGTLTISVRREDPGLLGAATALLVVEDTGVGIADDVREHLFEPFFTTKTRERGTGLGLSVVHGIVTALGGRVLVDSVVGAGTRMTVALPACAQAVVEAPPPAAPGARAAGRGQALVAEDDPLVRRTLEQGLRDAGFEVRAVEDGEAALAALEATPDVALVVLDLDLPRRTGPSCLREARARGVRTPTLVVTGNAARAEPLPSDERTRVLEKPFDLARLRAAVDELLRAVPTGS